MDSLGPRKFPGRARPPVTVDAPCSLVPCRLWAGRISGFGWPGPSPVRFSSEWLKLQHILSWDQTDTTREGQELARPCRASWARTQGPRGPCLPSVATCEQAQASFL